MAVDKQKKHRFNIVDFVLVIAVAACIVGAAVRYNLRGNLHQSTDTAEVTVLVEGLLETSSDALVPGDMFYNSVTDKKFGELISFEKVPARIRFINTDGTVSYTVYQDRVDVTMKLKVSGYDTENGFMLDGTTYIGCGSNFQISSRHIETQCTVLDIITD